MQGFIGLVSLCSLFISLSVVAEQVQSFAHGDWQVVCDNTHTCRAVGYHNQELQHKQGEYAPVSVILERAAGADAELTAKVKFGQIVMDGADNSQTEADPITLSINDSYPSLLSPELPAYQQMDLNFSGEHELTKSQLGQLLNALTMKGQASIKFINSAGKVWQLSATGSTAVLLKMDDFQGLVNTPFAIVKKGPRTTTIVQPKQAPVISIPKQLPATTEADRSLASHPDFITKMQAAINQSCDIAPAEDGKLALNVSRLSEHQLVVTATCWFAAYNYGDAVWLVDDNPKIEPKFITDSATNYSDGTIYEFMRGRGVGDCVSERRYIWNGSEFILADSYSTGACREIAAGGAWYLPTTVSTVVVGDDPAAGFDCLSEQAYSTEGMTKCGLRELASVDLKVAEVIKSINALELVASDSELTAAFSQAEASWLTYRNDVCKAEMLTYVEGSMAMPVLIGCKIELSKKRLRELQLTKESLIFRDF
ncbi:MULTISPECIES: DUF1176 domain-containing protein [unclassified Shewanella]|uniref:DUF1176 domain-containing protein n=1 Tax=unclassified Shewanella TaxID=196818 RepID=UPI001BC3569F|nr:MULTISPECIES: DUF1176 domain-containing protein [unclassified Shewanella]GIU10061.1 hypothetical protein TUM4444_13690 [Shewanella sp. MBTL60-112-B1]GIU40870.1 hypothetical protein TUM4445_40890 [Shewanella sp. MBTL60-112-B2]